MTGRRTSTALMYRRILHGLGQRLDEPHADNGTLGEILLRLERHFVRADVTPDASGPDVPLRPAIDARRAERETRIRQDLRTLLERFTPRPKGGRPSQAREEALRAEEEALRAKIEVYLQILVKVPTEDLVQLGGLSWLVKALPDAPSQATVRRSRDRMARRLVRTARVHPMLAAEEALVRAQREKAFARPPARDRRDRERTDDDVLERADRKRAEQERVYREQAPADRARALELLRPYFDQPTLARLTPEAWDGLWTRGGLDPTRRAAATPRAIARRILQVLVNVDDPDAFRKRRARR